MKAQNLPPRTRFAPSPTGYLHIGNGRTAVLNWLFARHEGGAFILRIEDTDRERSTREFEAAILEDLRWLGLDWDEGPDSEGAYGPYRQSERRNSYDAALRMLQEAGNVYPCYCTPEELETRRKTLLEQGASLQYDGKCRTLSEDEKTVFEKEGRKPSFRFRVDVPDVAFEDLVRGRIAFQGEHIGDFIVARPDGMPMYNFACVVDDYRMAVSHVIRGDDHLTNTSRQMLLYGALNWDPPRFVHIPMILGSDRVRLSKRHGATSVREYRKAGILPQALVNYLSLLSWSSETGDEVLSTRRLVDEFDFGRISKSAAVFDSEKLDWLNGVTIRQLDEDAWCDLVFDRLKRDGFDVSGPGDVREIAPLIQDKVERLSEISEKVRIFFDEEVEPEGDAASLLKTPEGSAVVRAFIEEMERVAPSEWNGDRFQAVVKHVKERTGSKGRDLWMPIRAGLTGCLHGPDLARTTEILGHEKSLRFLRRALGEKTD